MSFIPNQLLAGSILAIAGLALSPLTTFIGHHYSRTLYFAQLLYLFSIIFNTFTFSYKLDYSWLFFMPSFTTSYCSPGDFSCRLGHLISPAICWVGGAVLLYLIVKLIARKLQNLSYLKIYSFYRGLFYWFFLPLTYQSTSEIIRSIRWNDFNSNTISAIVVLSVFVLIGFIELIGTKCTQRQQQNKWRKWIYFFCHLQVSSMAVLLAIYRNSPNAQFTKYLLNIPLVLYAIIFFIKYKFTFKLGQRIAVFVQDAIIIAVYNIFVNRADYIIDYGFDFFGLAIVAVLELILLILKFIRLCKEGEDQAERSAYLENNPQPQTTRMNIANHPHPMYLPQDAYQVGKNNVNPFTNPPKLRPPFVQ